MEFGHEIRAKQIVIKDIDVLRGLMEYRFHPLIIRIVLEVALEYGIVITESYREKKHPNDLHGTLPVRAIDSRSWCYSNQIAEKIRDWINERWVYDPRRPRKQVAIIHETDNGGIHFHIQVHMNTRLRAYV